MLVSNRRHSIIMGAVHGVPSVGMGVEWHMRPFMDELTIGDTFIKLDDISADILKAKIEKTWNDRENVSRRIRKLLPDLRAKALQHGKLAADLINSRR